jgi:hypothetical protein
MGNIDLERVTQNDAKFLFELMNKDIEVTL